VALVSDARFVKRRYDQFEELWAAAAPWDGSEETKEVTT
jgi:hypothetical protein